MPGTQFSPRWVSKSKPSLLDLSDSFLSSKENQNPSSILSPVSRYGTDLVKILKDKRVGVSFERNIDEEIEEIEKEIGRLKSKLESLRLEKARMSMKSVEKRVRIVPAKFMEVKEKSCKLRGEEFGGLLGGNVKPLGPGLGRRGMSLGPAEIYSETMRLKNFGRQEMGTPIQEGKSRMKSCFWKLNEIDEVKAIKQRGKSLSPKSRKIMSTPPVWKSGAVTTIGSKKFVKKEDGIVPLVQPKNLFTDGEKSGLTPGAKKSTKNGRIVASRYSQANGGSAVKDLRKKLMHENDKEEGKKYESRRVSFARKSGDSQVKRPLEVMREVTTTIVDNSTPSSVTKMLEFVPKIKTRHCMNDSPRDSGAAKRVSELIGKRSYFSLDDNDDDDDEPTARNAFRKALGSIDEITDDCRAPKRVSELLGKYDTEDYGDWKSSLFQTLHFA
ncbi:hypothetical protein Droror1_Dr00019344 [Drosera rotundifolia]